jgi:transcriptional regulator with XRE-family HTH domain
MDDQINTENLESLDMTTQKEPDFNASVPSKAEASDLLDRRRAFGEWLRHCRRQARITQAELANSLQYPSSQLISNIERGVSLLPSRRIPDFARALGCSLLELEVRYFQCSARNTSESRMPDLLLKYLPVIEALEFGRGTESEILGAIGKVRTVSRPTSS